MCQIKKVAVTLPDESILEIDQGTTAGRVAELISKDLYSEALAARIDGQIVDLSTPIDRDSKLEVLTYSSPEARAVLLHSTAHVMAHAIKHLYPKAKIAIGPPLEDRFYYDIDIEPALTDSELGKIEEQMEKIIESNIRIERREIERDDAIELFKRIGEDYKVEIINEIDPDEKISIYVQGDFIDLCRGPHVPSTGKIRAFKLLNVAGAYWRGDSRNKMLTRVYGTSFPSKKELNHYLKILEEAKRRDHRRIGSEMELFEINENVGPGLVIWHPKGSILRRVIEEYWIDEHIKRGYQLVRTPHIGRSKLWETSKHLDFYREFMFDSMKVEGDEYFIKPMNCPFHIMVYKSRIRSYKDLPIRYAELGTVYRYELSGVLHGLMRVRGFTQDDAHIICTPEQLDDEIEKLVQFSFQFIKSFGFKNFDVYVATRPKERYIGGAEIWDEATKSLRSSLDKLNVEYSLDEGGGAFYGPKIDIKIRDALNRSWQCTTIQFDFNLPERFDMTYVDSGGNKRRAYMIHRAILGSLERFIGVLIEHTAGDFPVWLAPIQAAVLLISEKQSEYAKQFYDFLYSKDIRVELNDRNETIGAKIRSAELSKIPFMFIIGERESNSGSVAVRRRKIGDIGEYHWEDAINLIKDEIKKGKET